MNPMVTIIKKNVLAVVLSIAALVVGQSVWAANWTLENTGSKFIVKRSNSSSEEIVYYRTVSITALEGKHFTGVNGYLYFAPGDEKKEVSVTEKSFSDVPLRYQYQGTNALYYDFELTDDSGSLLASKRRTISSGDTNNNVYCLNNIRNFVNQGEIHDLAYIINNTVGSMVYYHTDISYTPPASDVETKGTLSGYVLIDDSYDYKYKSATVSPAYLYAMNRAGATSEWHKLIGNKLYASVVFTEKEKDDGYAYVQILIGDGNTAYDQGYDPDNPYGTVNTPVNSIYKACFELKKGSDAYSGNGKWIFPHSHDYHESSEEQGLNYSAFWMKNSYLWQQKFRSEIYRDGNCNNAFVLDPDIPAITVRFDCGGKNDDTYGYKDLFVRWALVDNTTPTVLKSDITIAPGPHIKGKKFTISVPFSEPVNMNSNTRYILHTSWGDLKAIDCDGSNVISFSGKITANPGTVLTINSIDYEPINSSVSTIYRIRDLVGNEFGGDVYKSFTNTVEDIYTISYKLKGGSIQGENPTRYTVSSAPITLVNPTREHFDFAGWTGTDLDGPTMNVTIPTGSTGNRSYTATWTPNFDGYWTGDGSEGNPFVISTAEGLDLLAIAVNEGIKYADTYFELGADIDLSSISPFRGIGNDSNPFCGKFDGKRHIISNFTVNADNQFSCGLFRSFNDGYLRNIVVSNATINGGRYVGAIVGEIDSSTRAQVSGCTAMNCTVSSLYSGEIRIGAIAGITSKCNISECVADGCSVSASQASSLCIGALVGYVYFGDFTNSVVSNCTVTGTSTNMLRNGTMAGMLKTVTASNLFALNSTINGTGIISGEQRDGGKYNNNHYHGITCGNDDPVSDVYTITASAGISVIGIAAVNYNGTAYYTAGTTITLDYENPLSGYTFNHFTYNDGDVHTITGNNFTMPANDVIVRANLTFDSNAIVTLASAGYGTYYNNQFDAVLPAGVKACIVTAESGGQLTYQCIADGDSNTKTIPAATAVLLHGNAISIGLTLSETDIDSRNFAGNLLHGSNVETMTTGGTKYYKLTYGTATGHESLFGWYWGAANGGAFTSGAHKVWLALPATSSPSFFGLPDGETTSLTLMEEVRGQMEDEWCDLQGRKLEKKPTQKGLYIMNGRKVVVK